MRISLRLGLVVALIPLAASIFACRVEKEDIGSGFVIKTRIYSGVGHTYRERDLYRRASFGMLRLVRKDISGAEVSPGGKSVLYFARKQIPDGIESVLYVYDEDADESVQLAEGRFYYDHDYWSPTGDQIVYKKMGESIVVFDVSERTKKVLVDAQHIFRGWSPSGTMIAHSTGKSKYDENLLYVTNLETMETDEVARKEGNWAKSDFHWLTENGVDVVEVR